MKYDRAETLREVLRRRDILLKKRRRRAIQSLSCLSLALTAMLLTTIRQLADPGAAGVDGSAASVYGSFLLSDEAGGYVLVGVAAFVLGIVFTFLCLRLRKTNLQKQCESQNDEVEGTQ